jgi:hypothetical protein
MTSGIRAATEGLVDKEPELDTGDKVANAVVVTFKNESESTVYPASILREVKDLADRRFREKQT